MSAKNRRRRSRRREQSEVVLAPARTEVDWAPALAGAAVVLLLGLVAYWNALDNEFIWDDPIVIEQQLVAFDSIADVFFVPPRIPQFGNFYYRPVVILTYLIDQSLWGHDPFGFHLSVVVFHLLVSLVVYALMLAWTPDGVGRVVAATVGGALFAVHPIHTESVAWMAGRSDVLAGLFFCLCLWLYDRYLTSGWLPHLSASAVAALVALLSKETAIALLPMLACLHLLRSRGLGPGRLSGRLPARGWWLPAIAFGVAHAAYLALRFANAPPGLLAKKYVGAEAPLRLIGAWAVYVRKLLLPYDPDAFMSEVPVDLAGVAAGLIVAAGYGYAIVRAWRAGSGSALLALAWLPVTLGPSLAIAVFSVSETPLAERYLYVPSVALSLLVALAVAWLTSRPSWSERGRAASAGGVAVGLAVAAICIWQCRVRNDVWQNELSFWEAAVAAHPDQGLPHLHVGLAYADAGRLTEAESHYSTALRVKYDAAGRSIAANNLGGLYRRLDDDARAERAYLLALEHRPRYAKPHYNLGQMYFQQVGELTTRQEQLDRLRRAELHLRQATQINPHYTKAHLALGDVMQAVGRNDEARARYRRVLELDGNGRQGERARRRLSRMP